MLQPSIARGAAALFAVGAVVLGARALSSAGTAAQAPAPCALPVEIEAGEVRLGCADELSGCGALAPGSRVVLAAPACTVLPGAMSGRARLALGLRLDVNRASAAELALLDGVGAGLAAAIVAHREVHGPYRDLGELDRVRGIGPGKLAMLEQHLEVVAQAFDTTAP